MGKSPGNMLLMRTVTLVLLMAAVCSCTQETSTTTDAVLSERSAIDTLAQESEGLSHEEQNVLDTASFELLKKMGLGDVGKAIHRLQVRCDGKKPILKPKWNACFANWMISELEVIDKVNSFISSASQSLMKIEPQPCRVAGIEGNIPGFPCGYRLGLYLETLENKQPVKVNSFSFSELGLDKQVFEAKITALTDFKFQMTGYAGLKDKSEEEELFEEDTIVSESASVSNFDNQLMQEEEEGFFEWVDEAADWTVDKLKEGYDAIKHWMCSLHVQPGVSVKTTQPPGIRFEWSQKLVFANPRVILKNVKDLISGKTQLQKSSDVKEFIRHTAQFLGTDIRLKLIKLNVMGGKMSIKVDDNTGVFAEVANYAIKKLNEWGSEQVQNLLDCTIVPKIAFTVNKLLWKNLNEFGLTKEKAPTQCKVNTARCKKHELELLAVPKYFTQEAVQAIVPTEAAVQEDVAMGCDKGDCCSGPHAPGGVCVSRESGCHQACATPAFSSDVYCKTGQYCRCGSMRNTCQDTPAPTFTNQQCKIVSEIFGVTVGSAAAPKPTAPSVDSIIAGVLRRERGR